MENRTIVVVVNGKRKEFEIECEKDVVIDDCSFELKKKKVTKNTLYVTGKKLGNLRDNYSKRREVATDVKLVALSNNTGLAYVDTDGGLYKYDGIKSVFVADGVTQIGFQNNTLFYISCSALWEYGSGGINTKIQYDVSTFSCGYASTMFISRGKLFAFGIGDDGVLGDYNTKCHNVDPPICIARNVRQVSTSPTHTVFVTNDNEMYGLGQGRYGRLGDKNKNPHIVLAPIFIKKDVKKVFTSHYNTMFITTSDVLYGLGDAMNGKMNDKISKNHDAMTPLIIERNVCDVRSNRENATLIKCKDGSIRVVGLTNFNQSITEHTLTKSQTVTHLTTSLMNEPNEKIGDFDINDRNIAFIVE